MRRDEPRLYKVGRIWKTWVYVDGRRVKRSTGKRTRSAAAIVARDLEQAAADPSRAAAEATTVEDALWESLQFKREQAKAGDRSLDTVSMYEKKNGQLVRLLGADTSLATFCNSTPLDAYVSARRREGVRDHTIYKEIVVMRSALKLAKRRGLWFGDLDAVLPMLAPKYVPRKGTIDGEHFNRLLAELSPDDAARAAFIIATGAELRATVLAERGDVGPAFVRLRGTKRASRARDVPIVLGWQRALLKYTLENVGRRNDGSGAKPAREDSGSGARHDGSLGRARRLGVAGPAVDAEGTNPGADGGQGRRLFSAAADQFRGALRYAARRAGLEHLTPNDLRRTYAHLLRAAGASLANIAPTMGHADTRMLERVYAVLPPALLAERLLAEVDRDRIGTDGSTSVDTHATGETGKIPKSVPRGGIEPPTRGFSVRVGDYHSPREIAALSASEKSRRDRIGTARKRA
jgi:integrase